MDGDREGLQHPESLPGTERAVPNLSRGDTQYILVRIVGQGRRRRMS